MSRRIDNPGNALAQELRGSIVTMKPSRIILTLHDVTPARCADINHALSIIDSCSDTPPALLVVPHFHHHTSLTDPDHAAFVETINARLERGSELFLHGFTHSDDGPEKRSLSRRLRARYLTADEGEFLNLSADEIHRRIEAGLKTLEALRTRPVGFVAPAWLYNRYLFQGLRAHGLPLTEGHLFIYDIAAGRRHLAPAISFSARSPQRCDASVRFARALTAVLPRSRGLTYRLALHPADFRHPPLVAAIRTLLGRITDIRGWTSYRGRLGNETSREATR